MGRGKGSERRGRGGEREGERGGSEGEGGERGRGRGREREINVCHEAFHKFTHTSSSLSSNTLISGNGMRSENPWRVKRSRIITVHTAQGKMKNNY